MSNTGVNSAFLTMVEQAQAAALACLPVPDAMAAGVSQPDIFLASSAFHGIDALLHYQLKQSQQFGLLPETIRQTLSRIAHTQTALVMVYETELQAVLNGLADANIKPLLLKGAPLSYSHYPHPALRTRCDTDLLILPVQKALAASVLEGLGYERPNATSGELVSYQFCYVKRDPIGAEHVIDLHWQINNAQVFMQTLSYAELEQEAVTVPPLGDNAHALCPVHALLLACLHRAQHLRERQNVAGEIRLMGNRLIWLFDIHLLVQGLSDSERSHFVELAIAKNLQVICLDALKLCQQMLNTDIPANLLADLASAAKNESAIQLRTSGWRKHLAEFQAVPSWRQRLRLAREHVLPPADYIRNKYGVKYTVLLPPCYLHRAIKGVWRQLR